MIRSSVNLARFISLSLKVTHTTHSRKKFRGSGQDEAPRHGPPPRDSIPPRDQGKFERWHQTLKNRILLENYYLPGDLENQIETFVADYNRRRYRESIDNLTWPTSTLDAAKPSCYPDAPGLSQIKPTRVSKSLTTDSAHLTS
jgi:transposase InsO family protein